MVRGARGARRSKSGAMADFSNPDRHGVAFVSVAATALFVLLCQWARRRPTWMYAVAGYMCEAGWCGSSVPIGQGGEKMVADAFIRRGRECYPRYSMGWRVMLFRLGSAVVTAAVLTFLSATVINGYPGHDREVYVAGYYLLIGACILQHCYQTLYVMFDDAGSATTAVAVAGIKALLAAGASAGALVLWALEAHETGRPWYSIGLAVSAGLYAGFHALRALYYYRSYAALSHMASAGMAIHTDVNGNALLSPAEPIDAADFPPPEGYAASASRRPSRRSLRSADPSMCVPLVRV